MKVEKRIEIFKKKENKEPKAWELCPKADSCNLNKCPLHEDYSKLKNSPFDYAIVHKQKCVFKPIRKAIGAFFNLKNRGLTERELSGAKKWEGMSEQEKQVRIEKIKKVSPVSRLLAKGCVIIPPKTNQSLNPQTKQKTFENWGVVQNG